MKIYIYKAYDKPSINKVKAWEYCKKLCGDYNGKNLRVLANTCFIFTAGFVGEIEDATTGEVKNIFVYITKSYDKYMEI